MTRWIIAIATVVSLIAVTAAAPMEGVMRLGHQRGRA